MTHSHSIQQINSWEICNWDWSIILHAALSCTEEYHKNFPQLEHCLWKCDSVMENSCSDFFKVSQMKLFSRLSVSKSFSWSTAQLYSLWNCNTLFTVQFVFWICMYSSSWPLHSQYYHFVNMFCLFCLYLLCLSSISDVSKCCALTFSYNISSLCM